jgi:uncharacterized protein YcaQ
MTEMNSQNQISKKEAQRLILNSQGLVDEFKSPYEVIKKLSYVQIDTISVAERAHHHVLFTHYKNYDKEELNKMMLQKSIFEFWSHAAAFLPIEDYRFSLYRKAEIRKDDKFWFDKDKKLMRYVLNRIKAEGPLQSKDFKNTKDESGSWYEWKPAKIALNHLFMEGKLMIIERQGFQKVFDLAERVLPNNIDTNKPSISEYVQYLIERAIDAQGIMAETEIGYLRKGLKPVIKKQLNQLVNKRILTKVHVEGVDEMYYARPEKLDSIDSIAQPMKLHLLSPFDNLVIQRKRALQLFDFDYQIECYLPEPKRTYGYFTLPILYGQQFIGRLDPKADRKSGVFHVKCLWFEADFIPSQEFIQTFSREVMLYAKFCGCEKIEVKKVMPTKYKKVILKAF